MSAWDYLILTASNARQAQAYESQLRLRRELGLLPRVRECFVAADLEDRRIGSGGSTVYCARRSRERQRAVLTFRGVCRPSRDKAPQCVLRVRQEQRQARLGGRGKRSGSPKPPRNARNARY